MRPGQRPGGACHRTCRLSTCQRALERWDSACQSLYAVCSLHAIVRSQHSVARVLNPGGSLRKPPRTMATSDGAFHIGSYARNPLTVRTSDIAYHIRHCLPLLAIADNRLPIADIVCKLQAVPVDRGNQPTASRHLAAPPPPMPG